MDKSFESIIIFFKEQYNLKYNELISRNSERLAFSNEEDIISRRAELLKEEFNQIYSSYGHGKYASELFVEFYKQKEKYPKASFLQTFQFAKEEMVKYGMGERNQIIKWTSRPNEELLKDMAEYTAWVAVMGDEDNNYGFKEVNEQKGEMNEQEINESKTKITSKKVKRPRPNKKTQTKNKIQSKMMIDIDSNDLLKSFHSALVNNYIEDISFQRFSDHFDGKINQINLNWIATDYEFLYLFDRLSFMLSHGLYLKNGSVKILELKKHFKIKNYTLNTDSLRAIRVDNKKYPNKNKVFFF